MSLRDEVLAMEQACEDMQEISAHAAWVVGNTRELLSDPRYDGGDRRLDVVWMPTQRFRAFASVRPGPPATDVIAVSYGVARELYRDSLMLPWFCENHFNRENYDTVYSVASYGDGTKRVLPPEFTAQTAQTHIMNGTLAWLYLHEQAHLFQDHGEIGAELEASWARDDRMIDETRDSEGGVPTGRSAALSQVFELAADHEALNCMLGLTLKLKGGVLPAHSVWALVAGLTCLFQRFYGGVERPGETVVGTHPDPSYRMRVLLREFSLMVLHPDTLPKVPWVKSEADLSAVMDHAVITATMYCHIRYLGAETGVSPFLPRVQGHVDSPIEYREALFRAWSEARPLILKVHRGWSDACVLDLPSVAHLS